MARGTAAAAIVLLTATCQPARDTRARITVATSWSGSAAEALNRELLTIANDIGGTAVEVRPLSFQELAAHLGKSQGRGGERLDMVVVPNDWLGQLGERGVIGELPSSRVLALQEKLVRQALLAVSDKDKVLGYPISAEVLALVYDPSRFPRAPRNLDDLLTAKLPAGTLPFALDFTSPNHLAPLLSSYQGSLVGVDGGFVWRDDVARQVVRRLEPVWSEPGAWRAFVGPDLDSLQLQLFAEGSLASFLTGPWMLDALEASGRPFAVMPVPGFADAPHPARALVGYQCVALVRDTAWADLALEVGARLLAPDVNERLNRATRRLPVLLGSYTSGAAVSSAGSVGFLRALEQGQFFPAAANWGEGFQRVGQRLHALGRWRTAPSLVELDALLTASSK